ncbi:hypothetical protein GCM10022223_16850 [Kineosporia mesophila]|uniref:DUF1772 domain-containing protein n=1 Tax=Kineosporia mesophila TaxID=566012 RepID=A0ABP6Z957_9ACTN|nr:hypothetical protein [Kineosporia mesophila]MCD5352077.1 hypothetical protein [Kineosporia mesophila]
MTTADVLLLTATAAHLGFQVTVTALVYPALARVPAQQWEFAHNAHSRAVVPLVAVMYGTLVLTGGWTLLSGPGGWTLVALAAVAATFMVTACAARVHGRLSAGHDREEVRRLLRIDQVRALTAALALVASALAVR